MCDPITIAMIATTVVSTAVSVDQANKAEDRANRQAQDAYKAAEANANAQYEEANRKIAENNTDTMSEKSDAIRKANEALGTMRSTETALSDSSLGSILFEEAYGNALNYTRIDENSRRQNASLESSKYAAEQDYITRTTQAANQAENYIAESNARKTNAILGAVGSSLQIGAQYNQNQKVLGAIKGTNAGASTTATK